MTAMFRRAVGTSPIRRPSYGGNSISAKRQREGCFHVNGRFLSQPITGVQRYAKRIVEGLDRNKGAQRFGIELVVPTDAAVLDLKTIRTTRTWGRGHLWDQAVFPARPTAGLISLCNTAPIAGRNALVCIHDCNVFHVPESYSWSFRTYYQWLLPQLAGSATRLVTVSKHAATSIADLLDIRASSIAVLPNGFEHALEWNASRSRFHNSGCDHRPFVLMIGSVAKHKNIWRIVGLAERLNEIGLDLRVVGEAGRIFADTRFAEYPNVEWMGRVSDDDLAWLLDHAMCLAFPSTCEGFGLPVLEAMARGCPVVASNRSSLPEICGEATLHADPDVSDEWVKAFAMLVGSRGLRDDLRQRGLVQSRRFSWDRSVEGYLDILADAYD